MRILLAADDPAGAFLLERSLARAGHQVETIRSAAEARLALRGSAFDAILTDWVASRPDGFDLIRQARAVGAVAPLILVVTAVGSDQERVRAIEAGADDYLAAPDAGREVLPRLALLESRRLQARPSRAITRREASPAPRPPFAGVAVAASAGGTQAAWELFAAMPANLRAAWFVALHGPSWMIETFAARLQRVTPMPVRLGAEGMKVEPGAIYLAPGDRHLSVEGLPPILRILDSAPENFVRPSADPLFRAVASVFGRWGIAVILTGMGRDGARGAAEIASAGGMVIAQDPETATARSMPQTIVDLGLATTVAPLPALPEALARALGALAGTLPPPPARPGQP